MSRDRRSIVALLAPFALALPLTAHAQGGLTAGLWENQVSMDNAQMNDARAKMQAQMASMSPQQRQMVERMMASHGAGRGAPGQPNATRVCISKEQAARGGVPQTDGRCQQTELSHSGNTTRLSFSCSGEHPVSGTGEFTMSGPTAYTMHSVTDTVIQGKPQRTEMNVSGRWLSADCGTIEPIQVPKQP